MAQLSLTPILARRTNRLDAKITENGKRKTPTALPPNRISMTNLKKASLKVQVHQNQSQSQNLKGQHHKILDPPYQLVFCKTKLQSNLPNGMGFTIITTHQVWRKGKMEIFHKFRIIHNQKSRCMGILKWSCSNQLFEHNVCFAHQRKLPRQPSQVQSLTVCPRLQ